MRRKRRKHSPAFKVKVALAALQGDKTLAQLSGQYDVHVNQIQTWRNQLKNNMVSLFDSGIDKRKDHDKEIKSLQAKIGYFGWYSNRMRGDRAKQELADKVSDNTDDEIEIIDVSKYKPKKIPPPTWRECIKKVWEVDPLKCPHCTGEMKIISFINEPDVIRKILEHLDLWNTPEQPRPPPEGRFTPPQHNPCPAITEQDDFDFFDDGWPGYEEPYISRD